MKIFSLFLLAFFLRTIILLKNKWVGIDTFYHLVNAKQIRKNKKNYYKFKKLIFPKGKTTSHFYPPLLPKLISFLPKKWDSYFRFFSPLLEMVSIFLLLIVVSNYVQQDIVLISLFVYALSPIMVLSSIVISPKIIGNLFFVISMIFLFFYFSYGNILFLIPFLVFNMGILLSHKMATQSLIIVTVLESIFFQDIFPAIFLVLSFFTTYFATKGYYKKILIKHIQILKKYYKIGGYKGTGKKRPGNPIRIFMMFPFMLVIFYYIFTNGMSQEILFFQVWFFSILLTSFFWFIGSGYRYMISAIFPGSILVGKYFQVIANQNLLLFFCSVISLVSILLIFKKFRKKIRSENAIKCFKYVKKHAKKNDIFSVFPMDYWHCGLYFADKKIFVPNKENKNKVMKQGKYKNYKINWIVTNNPDKIKKSKYKQVFRSKDFYVFKLK